MEGAPIPLTNFNGVHFQACSDVRSYRAFMSTAHISAGRIPFFDRSVEYEPSSFLASPSDYLPAAWARAGQSEEIIARYLGWAMQLPVMLVNTVEEIPVHARGFVVASFQDLTDSLLLEFLQLQRCKIRDGVEWDSIPQLGLVTGRTFNATSWMAAKIVASQLFGISRVVEEGVLIKPQDGRNWISSSRRLPPGHRDIDAILGNAVPLAALAIHTHGSESCAKAEDGIVFCGRSNIRSGYAPSEAGVLSCGRNYICPRGPRPTPIVNLATTIFMAACNGLRLGDSINHPDFNFAFAFVDGPGVAYASAVTSASGAGPATIAYLACIADGYDMGSAVIAANAVPLLARVADPAFICIGNVFHRPISARQPPQAFYVDGVPAVVDFGDAHTGIVYCRATDLIDRSRDGDLGIDASGRSRDSYTVNRLTDQADPMLEIRLFSYPDPLGTVFIASFSIAEITLSAQSVMHDYENWIACWRRLRLDERSPAAFDELLQAHLETRARLSEKIAQLRWAGYLERSVRDQISAARRFLDLVAAEAIELLAPSLSGSFWLTNELAADFSLIDESLETCPHCAAAARRRRLRHSLLAAERDTIVCGRCGILFDGPSALALSLSIEGPVHAGGDLAIRISIESSASTGTTTIVVQHTIPGETHQGLAPAIQEIAEGAAQRLFFANSRLGADVAPHRYYIKALLGTSSGISFASVPFFVHPGDGHEG